MSVHTISWVLKHSECEGLDRLCLLVLANYADEGGVCWPSVGRVAREMRVSESTARRHLQSLTVAGHVLTVLNGCQDERIPEHQRPNAYQIVGQVSERHPVSESALGGVKSGQSGVSLLTPKPSLELKRTAAQPRFAASGSSAEPTRPDFTQRGGCPTCAAGWVDGAGGLERCPDRCWA